MTAFIVGALLGLSGAVVGYIIGGLPGEIVGVFIAMPASLVVGLWMGGHGR